MILRKIERSTFGKSTINVSKNVTTGALNGHLALEDINVSVLETKELSFTDLSLDICVRGANECSFGMAHECNRDGSCIFPIFVVPRHLES